MSGVSQSTLYTNQQSSDESSIESSGENIDNMDTSNTYFERRYNHYNHNSNNNYINSKNILKIIITEKYKIDQRYNKYKRGQQNSPYKQCNQFICFNCFRPSSLLKKCPLYENWDRITNYEIPSNDKKINNIKFLS